MKLAVLLFVALSCAVSAQGVDRRILATLAEKWNLTDPSFAYASDTFNLTFPVTDFITTGMFQYSLWTAPGCQSDNGTSLTGSTVWKGGPKLVENEALASSGLAQSLDSGTFNGRNATVVAQFDPEKVAASDIYKSTGKNNQSAAEIRFCIRAGLWTTTAMGVQTPVEVNFLETLVTLTVNLTSGFEIGSINVAPKNRLTRTANQAYNVRGYECKETATGYVELTADEKLAPRNQGQVITVCVEPEKQAQTDGVYMRSIDAFSFVRTPTTGGTEIRQSAIKNNAQAGNLLTTYSPTACKGSVVCHFSTILFAQFFATPGTVGGQGTASMQFGSAGSGARQLRAERDLQAADSAGASQFDLNFEVAQGQAQSESGAGSTSMVMAMTMTALAAVAAVLQL